MNSSCYISLSTECSAPVALREVSLPQSSLVTTRWEPILSTNALAFKMKFGLSSRLNQSQACSTPCNLEPLVCVSNSKGLAKSSLHLRTFDTLPFTNKFQVLENGDGLCSPGSAVSRDCGHLGPTSHVVRQAHSGAAPPISACCWHLYGPACGSEQRLYVLLSR